MDFEVGDIVLFESAVAGKAKFHFCFVFNGGNSKYGFMFLNSEGEYEDHFAIDCQRIPEMKESRSGRTVFSCPTVIQKSKAELERLKPRKICTLPRDVAQEFLEFSKTIESMVGIHLHALVKTLKALSE
ncbi:hypothetical protein [Pseudochrobactrum asaccharolyticum]|uniref:Uncharacterized protein n=1 Tax=Pseudochrobactrum asaccharolyticum TaxID=354351 RepID=A0A366DI91_9HYPH|nr:hypothetical protein [Pseudochrobactrum asaccharolyticum]RBO89665.1 hypothetical protein DFR47_11532 [Pseudochrobactrum asaccharolyticum]